MTTRSRLTYLVPTVGRSPYLSQCLESLIAAGASKILLAVPKDIDLSGQPLPDPIEILRVPRQVGFTGSCNLSLAATEGDFVALVNDDAIVDPAWSDALVNTLEGDPTLAAAQGVNLQISESDGIDGCGIAWNHRWQAIQIGHGHRMETVSPPDEVFGVSCTAAILRRTALEAVSLDRGQVFDNTLGTYYEDVDLACRLRSRGWVARCVPTARARHAGAASSSANQQWRWGQIYSNRLLVLARLLGRDFLLRMPLFLGRDLLDLSQASLRLETNRALGILRGWLRALRLLPAYTRATSPMLPMAELRRLQVADDGQVESS